MTARAEWVTKTGLPPHLFEASREELAYLIFKTRERIEEAKEECSRMRRLTNAHTSTMRDATKWVEGSITREQALEVALVAEWERKP